MRLSTPPTFARRWHRATTAAGDRPFLVWEGGDGAVRQWSYAEFGELAGVEAAADVMGTVTPAAANLRREGPQVPAHGGPAAALSRT